MKKIVLYLVLYPILVGCSTKVDELHISDEQVNHRQSLYDQAIEQLYTDPAKTIQTAKEMLEWAENLKYSTGISDAHYLLGLGYDFRGRYDSSAYHHLIALEQRRELDDKTKLGKSYDNLGIVYLQLGLIREARNCQEAAIATWERLSNKLNVANAYHNLGVVEQEAKRYGEADAAYTHSLHLYQELDNQAQIGRLYNDLGAVNELKVKERSDSTANDSTVLACYRQALRLSSTNDGYALGLLMSNIGHSYNSLHQPDSGLTFLLQAKDKLESLPQETLESHTLVNVYNGIADSYIQKADFTKAIEILEKAEGLDQFVVGPLRKEFLDTYQLLQDIFKAQNNPVQVSRYQKKHQGIQAELANIKIVAENVQLRSQVQVKNQEKHLLYMSKLQLEAMDHFAKTILIPVSVLLFLLLMLAIWWHLKKDRQIRQYEIMLMSGWHRNFGSDDMENEEEASE